MEHRPDPDELLKNIQSEEPNRGKLKIFLGYAAGVGKTYAMLEAAHQRKIQGIDVVVGYVETHKRAETEELVEGLDVLPRKQVEYRGVALPEMDVDEVIKRHPAIVLVDEFAHTNAPGSRHPKRYMDVEEILDAGIDVYTTLNIQHLESLNDVVAQVTGVIVRETVPDRVLDEASEIEVIDLPPDELMTRLKEGKVYIPEQASRAIDKFFRKGNLTALREMSLRRAAERVDDQMRSYMQTRAISGPWAAGERLVVCISPSPLAEKLIRTTRRLADELNAEWYAVYVEIASKPETKPANRERIGRTLQLAEELGAKSLTIAGRSIQEAVLDFAHKNNITKVVVGKPLKPRWQELWNGSIVDQLIYASGDIDVYVISARSESSKSILPREWQLHRPFGRYLLGLLLVTISTSIGLFIRGNLEPANLVMLYLASTVISAIYLGRGPSLLTAVAGVLAFDYFLVPPYLTFAVSDTQYFITFIALLVISLVVSSLTARVREQAEAAIQREKQTAALYDLSKDLTSAADLLQVANIIISQIGHAFGRDVAIFLPDNQQLQIFASSPNYQPDENELAVAAWAYQHDQPAGRGTDTLPAASLRCHPLKTSNGIVGVLGVHSKDQTNFLSSEQRLTLAAFANQSALAIERTRLSEQASQAELLRATESLQTALLNSISHDLRTPLVSITGALSSLDEDNGLLNESARRALIENARGEADRLNRLVGNLLNMTRIESGAIKLRLESEDIQDVIGTALEQLGSRVANRKIQVNVPVGFPLVPMDFTLIAQVLVNVLENAVKYSPADSTIEVSAELLDETIRLKIADRGAGIPSEDLTRIFDKFYRVQRPENVSGTGLGLSISKGIVEVHHGTIYASAREGGGTIITIELPLNNTG
ncbi:sensor histidine kinase KdpD [Candidatus Villigracilis affinis]|uniref:sensor histidine kinase KdpD n=1 Tax=Candidatus Villigracilis affinis TaxID=3140682 RepID=UPI001E0FCA04|nr:sensor histidine kinase KdpD [Anaerolineales bacterium]